MKISKNLIIILILVLCTNFTIASPWRLFSISFSQKDITPLKSRSYYEKAFDAKERKTLKTADKKRTKAQKTMLEYQKYYKLYLEYQKYISLTKDPKKIKTATKKSEAYLKKTLKYGYDATEQLVDANQTIYTIYNKKLSSFKLENNLVALKDSLMMLYTMNYDTSYLIRVAVDKNQDIKNLEKIVSACKYQDKAIFLQELSFGLFYDDKEIIDTVQKLYTKKITPPKVVEISYYNKDNDPNLYFSKREILFKKLLLSKTEKDTVTEIKKLETKAKEYNLIAEEHYNICSEKSAAMETETNFVKKRQLTEEATKNQAAYFENKNYELQNYIIANKQLYKLYTHKMNDVRKDSADLLKKGLNYENLANKYYVYSEIAETELTAKNDETEYLKRLKILNFQLIALQNCENAISTYFNLLVSDVTDNFLFTQDEATADIYKKDEPKKDETKKDDTKKDETKKDDTKKDETKKDDKYVYESSWYYDSENPDLKKLEDKKGTYFKVQCGIFKDMLPIKEYKNFEPITVDKFKDNKLIRVMVGEYQTYEAAELALEKIKPKYSDAYIVAYVDGKRTTYATAKPKIVKNEAYNEQILKEKAKINGQTYAPKEVVVKDETKKDETKKDEVKKDKSKDADLNIVKAKNVADIKNLSYLVQFAAFSVPKTEKELNGLTNIYTFETKNKLTRYLVGTYETLDEANVKLLEIKKLGYDDAYVTAFKDGYEVGVTDKEKSKTKEVESADNKIIYKVQIGAYIVDPTDKSMYDKFPNIKDKYKFDKYTTADNLIAYTIGSCKTFTEVSKLSDELSKLGVSDRFIVAFKGTARITLSEAKKITD